jgi:hypothetical protein
MEGLNEQEKAFFESGGDAVMDDAPDEAVVEEAPKTEVVEEPKVEKKKPSQFQYSEDTDNVVDENGRKYVPLGAVQEARNENKTLRKELDELKTKWTGGEKRLNDLLSKLEPKNEPPKYEENPLENLKARNDALEAQIKAIEEKDGQRTKEAETNTHLARFQSTVLSAEKAFAAKTPDYADAVGKVQEIWRAELEMAGIGEDQIDEVLSRKGAQFSYAAMQKGQNPAEAVYKLAQRIGYAPKEVVENKDKTTLKTIAKGQEAEKSLASSKSGSGFGLEALASMSDDDMDEFVSNPKNWNKLKSL